MSVVYIHTYIYIIYLLNYLWALVYLLVKKVSRIYEYKIFFEIQVCSYVIAFIDNELRYLVQSFEFKYDLSYKS